MIVYFDVKDTQKMKNRQIISCKNGIISQIFLESFKFKPKFAV